MEMKSSIVSIVLVFLMHFCAQAQEKRMTTLEYIDSFKLSAVKEMAMSKVPASITLAQGILESSSGNSRLAKEGNNHFGIKCKRTWTGNVIYEDDDALQECFRAYPNALESYKDHSAFLRNNQRYSSLFTLNITDYKGWAKGLQKAGYATNKKYGHMLINLIERYNLHQYDLMDIQNMQPDKDSVLSNSIPAKEPIQKTDTKVKKYSIYERKATISQEIIGVNSIKPRVHHKVSKRRRQNTFIHKEAIKNNHYKSHHVVELGESLYSIAMKYDITPQEIRDINALTSDNLFQGQKLLIERNEVKSIQKIEKSTNIAIEKAEKIEENNQNKEHVVKKGETLYSISRAYNISIDTLTKVNKLPNTNLVEGQILIIAQ